MTTTRRTTQNAKWNQGEKLPVNANNNSNNNNNGKCQSKSTEGSDPSWVAKEKGKAQGGKSVGKSESRWMTMDTHRTHTHTNAHGAKLQSTACFCSPSLFPPTFVFRFCCLLFAFLHFGALTHEAPLRRQRAHQGAKASWKLH